MRKRSNLKGSALTESFSIYTNINHHLFYILEPEFSTGSPVGEGRPDVVARLCMVVDWCIDHPEYTAKIKVIPKKDYPVLMPCEF